MKTCPKREELVLHAARESAPERASAIEAHVGSCDACAREVVTLRRGLETLRLLEREPAVRAEAMEALRDRAREAAAQQARRPVILSLAWRHRWVAAAAALVLAATCWHVYGPGEEMTTAPGPSAKADLAVGTDALEEVAAAVELLAANLGSASDLSPTTNGSEATNDATDDTTDDTTDDVHLLLEYLSGGSGSQS